MDIRDYAVELVEEGIVDPVQMVIACVKYMSVDEVTEMLHMNEMAPSLSCADE